MTPSAVEKTVSGPRLLLLYDRPCGVVDYRCARVNNNYMPSIDKAFSFFDLDLPF